MRILFADPLDPERIKRLEAAGHQCVVQNVDPDELPGLVSGCNVLVVRSTNVTAATIEAATELELIVRAGAGVDNIDRAAASAHGIYLCNVPGRNAIAVAELTMGLLLAVDRRLGDGIADLRAGQWNKAAYTGADGLHGKRMAIIGLGEIGLAVAERAKAFGMRVEAVRKDGRPAAISARIRSIGVRLTDDLDDLLADADVVSIHVPKSAETVGLVDEPFLSRLKDGTILLNTSRGEVVDEAALLRALNERGLRAGLDVFANEPSSSSAAFDSEIARHPSVVGSHHIGASTRQAQRSVADGVVEVIESFDRGRPENCLNLVLDRRGAHTLSIRHLDRVGVLAKVLNVLGAHGLNVQQMQNQVFEGDEAAVATINVHGTVTQTLLTELQALSEVISATETGV